MAQGPNKDPASVLRVQAMLRGTGLLPGKLRYHWGLSHLSQGSEAGRMLPMLQLSAAEKASTQWSLKAHRHQRFPTLNDLFWVPGGNLMLRAELGWEIRASPQPQIRRYRTLPRAACRRHRVDARRNRLDPAQRRIHHALGRKRPP